MQKAPNLSKIGCFSFENGTLMGGLLCEKLVYRKSNFPGPAGTSTYNLGGSTPSGDKGGSQIKKKKVCSQILN